MTLDGSAEQRGFGGARPVREGRLGNVSGALLVGGESSRMGSDKARLVLGERGFAAHLVERMARFFDDVFVAGGDPIEGLSVRHVHDEPGPASSLRGLVSALAAARCERVVVVATDLPLLTPELILALTAWPEHAVVAPRSNGQRHALCAIYRPGDVLSVARQRLARGELQLSGVLDSVDADYIEGEALDALDPDGSALLNVNTLQELAHVRRLYAQGRGQAG